MFGISWAEFLVVLLIGMLVIPTRHWPDVAKFLARLVNFIRNLVWRVTDASEKIKEQIEREAPIDNLIKTTTDDILAEISEPIKKLNKKTITKKSGRGRK